MNEFTRGSLRRAGIASLALALCLVSNPSLGAGGRVKYFELESREEFVEGTLQGIAIDPLGVLTLADRADRVADLGEPFLLSAAVHPDGWVIGTGNDGKILLVRRDGSITTLFDAEEPEVFAVAVAGDGAVYAGTSPRGKVYRIDGAGAKAVFDPGQVYIWDLEPMEDGSLLIATGTDGKLFRLSAAGSGEMIFDSEDTHLRVLESLSSGEVLIGTAGDGLVLRMRRDGSVRTIFDADQPEVVAFAEGPGDTHYAAVLASEASQIDLGARAAAAAGGAAATKGDEAQGDAETRVTVSVEAGGPQPVSAAGSRPAGFQGPRSEIVKIGAGRVEMVWAFETETVHSLSWQRDRLWVGTGLEGKVFSLQDGRMFLEKDLDERQVISILADASGPVYATTNSAALFRVVGEPERSGVYLSPVLDAGQTSDFGSLSWSGVSPKGTAVRFSARTGMSGRADKTWSEWSVDGAGTEVSLAGVPPGRFLQWRAELESGNGASPELSRITVSYRQQNLPPRIRDLEVLDPGEVVVPPGFVPGSQTFEPSRPDKGGMFSVLRSPKEERARQRKTLWKQGYRALSWKADDPNGDELVYALYFKRDRSDMEWLPMADDLELDFFSFDATALADGRYRFKLEARDRRAGELEPPLRSVEISEPATIDHTPPRLVESRAVAGKLEVEVADAMNPVAEARYSIDAGEWLPARAEDGLLDGRQETLVIDLRDAGGARMLLLRTVDAAHNAITFDLSPELP